MEKTTAELTNEYIEEHPHIKNCLKKNLINYSALSRLIASDLKIEKKTSKEAILIAARRFQQKLEKEKSQESKIKQLISESEMEIKNKIIVFILEKNLNLQKVTDIQRKVTESSGKFLLLQGSDNYTVITQEKYSELISKEFSNKIVKKNKGLALINFKTSADVEDIIGVMAYLTSLFGENGVNILELLSCWKDNLFVIKSEDVAKAMNFLKF